MSLPLEVFISIFEKGGPILTIIFAQFLLMWFFATQKFIYFKYEFQKDFEKMQDRVSKIGHLSNSFLYELRVKKEASELKSKMNRQISLIKVLVMLCPLLGLLGTVTGMISVFDVLAVAGSGNARAMASGISKATIPTMAGMVGALVGLFVIKFLKDHLASKSKNVRDYLSQISLQRKETERSLNV